MFVISFLAALQWISLYKAASAQTTQAVCTPEHAWMFNSKGQNPCLVAAYLHLPCAKGQNTNVDAMTKPTQFYTAINDECQCNMVSYALFQACQNCQFDNGTSVNSYSRFTLNCTTQNVGYPESVPVGTAVPAWAYQDVTATDVFNLANASIVAAQREYRQIASLSDPLSPRLLRLIPAASRTGLPDTTASLPAASSLPGTNTITTQTSPATSTEPNSPSIPPSAAASSQPAKPHTNVGPVVGGVAGGVLGLVLLGGMAFCYLRRRGIRPVRPSTGERQTVELMSPVYSSVGKGDVCRQWQWQPQPVVPMTGVTFYNPEDPRTYPYPSVPPAVAGGRPLSLRAPVPLVQPARQTAALAYYKGPVAAVL
ncbi:hypothetical protein L226DRAFT_613384 [Lentinus tigrinus ALCF2SS1-7]|uniref:Uncharacterized protein n=1 Tax=Lentinus tigrinus ALCF2SS1-6 TaxID=1328759 RepID=A0A5C2SKR3_9APHY|nr:hypothetical protein L227DRAFT_609916 [Lentinus tigrinus ALCF2SS1-6]RPD74552.1 hypothetical protein L226DRAFT_613384 [Lentinus tigrinus ALCF2SS1-7]